MSESQPSPVPADDDLHTWEQSFRSWVFSQALPFWADAGMDAVPGSGFCEHLRLDGVSADVPYKRVRVQARQIYVFSHAFVLGWRRGLGIAAAGYDFIRTRALLPTGAWVRTLSRAGGVLDSTADLYDLAFVLFALAWYARASGSEEPLSLANRTLDFICTEMRHPRGGFYNTLPIEGGARQQNPHMHLLEAVLALYETSPQKQYLQVARELVALFRERFFDAATGTLGELFNEDLTVCAGDAGDRVEPGHHYEWVWLLNECSKVSPENTVSERRALYRFAEAHGVDPETGAVLDAVRRDGRVLSSSRRLWPQTECIKAQLTMLTDSQDAPLRLRHCLANVLGHHFADCPPGTWREHFDAQGRNLVDKIPSSSLYHVFMACAELVRARP